MKNYSKSSVILGIIIAFVTIVCAIATASAIIDKRKKKENEELERYLDGAIQ